MWTQTLKYCTVTSDIDSVLLKTSSARCSLGAAISRSKHRANYGCQRRWVDCWRRDNNFFLSARPSWLLRDVDNRRRSCANVTSPTWIIKFVSDAPEHFYWLSWSMSTHRLQQSRHVKKRRLKHVFREIIYRSNQPSENKYQHYVWIFTHCICLRYHSHPLGVSLLNARVSLKLKKKKSIQRFIFIWLIRKSTMLLNGSAGVID